MTDYTHREEFWLPVVGYEGYYEVSSLGRVRNVAPGPGRRKGHVLSPSQGTRYAQIALCRDGHPRTHYVHRLVCVAFHGPPPDGLTDVLHWDDNPRNNEVSNLRWGTASDNLRDAVRNGGYQNQNTRKTHCIRGHVLPESRKCLQCPRDAKNARVRTGLPEDSQFHGTLTGYTSWGCKCERCKGAQRRYYAARKS